MHEINIHIPSSSDLERVEQKQLVDPATFGRFVLVHNGEVASFKAEAIPQIIDVDGADEIVQAAIDHIGVIIKRRDFDLEQSLRPDVLGGPIIEVVGPTPRKPHRGNYNMLQNLGTMPDDILISNRSYKGVESYIEASGRKVDYLADACHLPHLDESIGAILVSNLDRDAYPGTFGEMARVTKSNGLLVADGITPEAVNDIIANGFEPEALQVNGVVGTPGGDRPDLIRVSGIFKKVSRLDPAAQR